MNLTSHRLLLASSLVTFAACGDEPPAPGEVRARIAKDLGHVLTQSNAAFEATAEMPGSAAFGIIDQALGSDSEIAVRLRNVLGPRGAGGKTNQAFDETVEEEPVGLDTDETIAWLNDNLFTDANHLGDGVYQVPASLVCTTQEIDDQGNVTESIDPECAQNLATAQLRIRVAENDDALRFAIQVTADRDEPLEIALSNTAVSLTVDLDEAWDAAIALAPLFGEPLPNARLGGRITGKLEVLGTAKARASVTIDRAIDVAFAEDAAADLDGPSALRFSSAAGTPFAVTLDGAAKTGELALGVAATKLHVPGDEFDPERMELDLPGLTATATLGGNALTITNIGLGDRTTTMSINGAVATAIDLNPNDGRKLDATITHDAATGTELVSVSPRLDLRTTVDHAVLGEEPPVYDVTQVFLEGSLRSSELSNQVKVESGTYRIATNPASYGFTATAGQCVSSEEVVDATSGAYYTQWTVGTCQ